MDEEGKQVGILTLSEALKKAQEQGLDLIEIAAEAKPPVVKIIDFQKFKYLEDKKDKEARKHTKQTELKEVRFSPFIGEHDLQTGLKKVRGFLKEGHLVKISIVFTGRQMAHQEFGPKLLERIMDEIEAEKERPERMEGRRLNTLVRAAKKSQSQEEVEKTETEHKGNETKN